jgi:hypothetical protein
MKSRPKSRIFTAAAHIATALLAGGAGANIGGK